MVVSTLIDIAEDKRIDCHSVLFKTTIQEFLRIVEPVYKNAGGISGQRPALKTKTAKIIRSRLVDDIGQGAIIPPIVLGVHVGGEERRSIIESNNSDELIEKIKSLDHNTISIIDGMQRTTAIIEAVELNNSVVANDVRVELWVAENLNSLIYRMLVLNTGQIPWEIARQLETVYSQLIHMVKKQIGEQADIYLKDNAQRRSSAGQYQASMVIRLYLAFSARRAEFDLKDRVAEDFARLDAIETSSYDKFTELFVATFDALVRLDKAFSNSETAPKPHDVRIADGQEIFQTAPALVGFFVAVAVHLFGEPGFEVEWDSVDERMSEVGSGIDALSKRLEQMEPAEVTEFLQLDYLNERLSVKTGQVGRFERDLFVRAFRMLLEKHSELKNMTPCWVR